MTGRETLSALQIEHAEELLAPHWDDTAGSQPAGAPDFLRPEVFLPLREYVGFPVAIDSALVATAQAIVGSPPLLRLAWHCQQLLYEYPDYPGGQVRHWPSLEHVLGADHRLFYVLLALSATPLVQRWHREHGIPERITRDTVRQHAELNKLEWWEAERRWHGSSMSLYWTRHHVAGRLLALGRFEYMVGPFPPYVHVYRQRGTGRVAALAADRLQAGADGVEGDVVSPRGDLTGERVTLARHAWDEVLQPGDPILDVHIPFGESMTPERCRDSLAQALEFFPRHFPERTFKGFACASWVLNPDLEEMLGAQSNMVRWQQELYLFPWPSGPLSGLAEAFGDKLPNLATAPRETKLQRAMLDRVATGKPLRLGGMFLLPEEFGRYGEQPYRTWEDQA